MNAAVRDIYEKMKSPPIPITMMFTEDNIGLLKPMSYGIKLVL